MVERRPRACRRERAARGGAEVVDVCRTGVRAIPSAAPGGRRIRRAWPRRSQGRSPKRSHARHASSAWSSIVRTCTSAMASVPTTRRPSSTRTDHCSASTRMVHITDYPCFHEQGYYTPGDTGAPVYRTQGRHIGVAICYDRHYPEYMRALALGGADLVVVPQAGSGRRVARRPLRSRDAGRGVSERLLRRAVQSGRRRGVHHLRGRVLRVRARWPRDRAGARRWTINFLADLDLPRMPLRTPADSFCSTGGRSSMPSGWVARPDHP